MINAILRAIVTIFTICITLLVIAIVIALLSEGKIIQAFVVGVAGMVLFEYLNNWYFELVIGRGYS
jgi:hypothetical protein